MKIVFSCGFAIMVSVCAGLYKYVCDEYSNNVALFLSIYLSQAVLSVICCSATLILGAVDIRQRVDRLSLIFAAFTCVICVLSLLYSILEIRYVSVVYCSQIYRIATGFLHCFFLTSLMSAQAVIHAKNQSLNNIFASVKYLKRVNEDCAAEHRICQTAKEVLEKIDTEITKEVFNVSD